MINYKFSVITLGCKVNQYESDAITLLLEAGGWKHVNSKEKADCYIINTCTVTQKASMQSRQAVRQAIRRNPHARVIVTGCYAQTEPDEIKKISGVDSVVGHADKHNIPNILVENTSFPSNSLSILSQRRFKEFPTTIHGSRTRPFLKIQDGCSTFCSYCIVPYSRGPSRSMPIESVLKNLHNLNLSGFMETVLTGIHLGSYGNDLCPETSLYELMNLINNANPINRIRLSSIEPHELTDEIIKLIAESKIFCDHFHIPLQSGDDLILKKMHRPYTSELFKKKIQTINRLIPDASIGTDVLIGFPGETDQAFDSTYSLIKALPITYLHVFPFSERQKTPAAKYNQKINPLIIKQRAKKIRELGIAKKKAFFKRFIGQTVQVLIEGKRNKKTGFLKGITSNYIPVLAKGDNSLKNRLVNIKITDINGHEAVSGIIET